MQHDTVVAKPILVVEDDAAIRNSMTLLLEMEGYKVQSAANGAEALTALRQKELPCLILLDLMMPVMDGWEFRQIQRQDPNLARVPVILVSAAPTLPENAADLAAADYLQKPVEVETLLATIQKHC
jgi:CheY-like chemotaxis protein